MAELFHSSVILLSVLLLIQGAFTSEVSKKEDGQKGTASSDSASIASFVMGPKEYREKEVKKLNTKISYQNGKEYQPNEKNYKKCEGKSKECKKLRFQKHSKDKNIPADGRFAKQESKIPQSAFSGHKSNSPVKKNANGKKPTKDPNLTRENGFASYERGRKDRKDRGRVLTRNQNRSHQKTHKTSQNEQNRNLRGLSYRKGKSGGEMKENSKTEHAKAKTVDKNKKFSNKKSRHASIENTSTAKKEKRKLEDKSLDTHSSGKHTEEKENHLEDEEEECPFYDMDEDFLDETKAEAGIETKSDRETHVNEHNGDIFTENELSEFDEENRESQPENSNMKFTQKADSSTSLRKNDNPESQSKSPKVYDTILEYINAHSDPPMFLFLKRQ